MISAPRWSLGALARLCAGVFLSAIVAAPVLGSLAQVFSSPQQTGTATFIACNVGALACLLVSLIALQLPWTVERLIRNLAVVFVFGYTALFLIWLASKTSPKFPIATTLSTGHIIAAVISFQGMTLILAHFLLRRYHVRWAEAFGLTENVQNALLIGLMFGMIAVPVGGGLQVLSGSLMNLLHIPPQEQQAVQALRGISGWCNRIALGVAAILLAPLGEEVLFRGILYPAIKQIGYPRLALISTSIAFGLIHMNMATFIPLTVLALAFVWLYEKTGNLLAPIVAHSVFNLINFIMLFVDEHFIHMPGPK
jgi:uncharacterized protein